MKRTLQVIERSIPVLIFLLLIVYLVNCFTPLRLTFDTIRYLKIKEWIEAGRPAGAEAASDFLPHGYVWFLYLLDILSICTSQVIALIQLLLFLAGGWILSGIDGYKKYRPLLLLIGCLNWAALKFVITPLSEMQFIFFTCLSIFFFYQWDKIRRPWDLICCVIVTVLAVMTRTAGISLVAAYFLYYVFTMREHVNQKRYLKYIFMGVAAAAISIAALADALHIKDYLDFLGAHFSDNYISTTGRNIWLHLIDFASLFLNLPSAKVPFMDTAFTNVLFFAAGIFFITLLIYFLVSRRSPTPLIVRLYLAVYLLMIMNWPYFEPRFFLPVLPFIILMFLENIFLLHLFLRKTIRVYIVLYGLIGVAALGYYTYTSLIHKELARRQDAGIWRNEYETYFYGKPMNDTATLVREPIVELLKKYNSR